jgi:gas vesicle protein
MKSRTSKYLSAFVLGSLAGGIITLLYTPFKGEEVRNRIGTDFEKYLEKARQMRQEMITRAKVTADSLILKTFQLSALLEKYGSGMLDEPIEKIEKEIKSLKTAIAASVAAYMNGNDLKAEIYKTDDLIDGIFSDYDNVVLPKN